jgi:hypothetical protein
MRDDFTEDVKRVIAHRASLTCSNPDCGCPTGGPQDDPTKALNVGVAAHISAAASRGPRYNPDLSPEQRMSAENGIWLCQNCAKLVDNDESQFTCKILDAWKTSREFSARMYIGQTIVRRNETESERKCREILKWKSRRVMLVKMPSARQAMALGARPWSPNYVTISECNEFFVIIDGGGWERSVPLDTLKIGWDSAHHCLELLEYPG